MFSVGLLDVLHHATAAASPLEKAINVGNLPHVGPFFKVLTPFQSLPVLENFPEPSMVVLVLYLEFIGVTGRVGLLRAYTTILEVECLEYSF